MGAHLRQFQKSKGIEEEVSAFPMELRFLWGVFNELNLARTGGFGVNPITYTDIWCWCQLKRVVLEPWKVDAIKKMDVAFVGAINERGPSRAESGSKE